DPAFILDLSEGGIAIQSLAPMQHGQVVRLTFQLPGTTSKISSTAKVVWNDPTGRIGMEFDDLGDFYRKQLKHWVEEKLVASPEKYVSNPEIPASVRVLSRWMRPLAIAIDSVFVSIAAAVFCAISYFVLRGEPVFPVAFTYLVALSTGSVLYSSLF